MWHEKSDVDEKGVERVKQSEKMVKLLSLAKNIPAFKGKNVEEVFSNEDNKRNFIENLNEADFIDLVKGINALLRGKGIDSPEMEWTFMTTKSGFMGTMETFSSAKDKPELYALLHNNMQSMNRNGESMEDIALLCGASINAIHGFGDGNGRTSRFVYSMLNDNLNDNLKKSLRELLTEDGRNFIDINPVWIGDRLDKLIEKEVGIEREGENKTFLQTVEYKDADIFKRKTSEQDFKELRTVLKNEDTYLLYAIYDCLKNDINEYVPQNIPYAIVADWLFEDLSAEEIKKIITRYWELKKRKVEILIDCIAHSKKEEYQTCDNGIKISLKDYLKEKIKNESEENKQRREDERIKN